MQEDVELTGSPGGMPSGLWQDVLEVPEALASTLQERQGFSAAARLLGQSWVKRIVVSGNGAAYYVATALWLASLVGGRPGPAVCAVPSGLVARGRFVWRPGDMFVAVSSSGEFRDLVEAIGAGAPRPYIAVTSSPGSTVAAAAEVAATFEVANQRALTHSQVFCGGIATVLSLWAELTGDRDLGRLLDGLPDQAQSAIERTIEWHCQALDGVGAGPRSAVVCGTGAAWTAALEAALLLKEVARVPSEGSETREAATSGMYALGPTDLAFTLPGAPGDPLMGEAELIFGRTGARVLRAPTLAAPVDERLMAVTAFPASAALAIGLARRAGLDPDAPDWATTYYGTAR